MSNDSTFKELPVISVGPIVHSPNMQDPIVGIDLGTTNSLIAIVDRANNESTPRIISTLEGERLLPSVVHFLSDENCEIGFSAKKFRGEDPKNTIYSVKRLLGRSLSDIENSNESLTYDLDSKSETNIKIKIGKKSYTPIEISSYILRALKDAAEADLGRSVEDAVITVPAYFNDSQRQATRAAGRIAGFNVLRIVNEPTAASLAYGIQKKQNGLIAVYDLGGGTFDISILRLRNGIFEVLATNGDTSLGGDDIDLNLAHLLKKKLIEKGFSSASDETYWPLLVEAAEKVKIAFSTSAIVNASVVIKEQQINFSVSAAEFELALQPLLSRTEKPVVQAISDAGIEAKDLTDVVLVGGPTRLPSVRKYVESLLGRHPNCSLNPDETVALGAAIQADILAGFNDEMLLLDVTPLSLGIETYGGAFSKLIGRNTRVPAMAKEHFTTYVDGQTKVALNVFQGERDIANQNRKLAEFVLSGIPPLPRGVARIEVTFLVDADGILNVAAKEIYSEVQASIEVKPTYGLTDAEVEKLLSEGIANQESDRKQAQLIEARNDAETILTATHKALGTIGTTLNSSERNQIEEDVKSLESACRADNLTEIKKFQKKLNQSTQNLATLLMNQTVQKNLKNSKVDQLIGPKK